MTPAGDRGQSVAEFGILIAVIVLVVIGALFFFGDQVSTVRHGVGTSV